MSRNVDYTARNVLDYLYDQNNYKLIDTDLLGQTKLSIAREINFVWKLKDYVAAISFITEKQEKSYSELLFSSINCNRII